MAASDAAARLTEAHRVAQANLVAETMKDVVAVWPALDPAALDASFPGYARALRSVLAARRSQSANLSAAYLRAFREAEGILGPLDVALADALAIEQATTSLLVTGPVAVKVATRAGKPIEAAAQTALTQTLGAAARLVHSGGRETVHRTILRDSKALGVQRVADGDPCAFCAMLASRGAVYKSEMTADFRAHDHCGCHAEPVYRPNGALPGRAQEFRDLWDEATKGLSGDDAIAAFRKAYSGR